MFRRTWSSLPKDAEFADDLEGLGYFVNDADEIRNIQDPDYYFKYFLTRNDRVNQRQRMQFNRAVEEIVHKRLEAEGLQKVAVPLETPPHKPHVPIFISSELKNKSRVVLFLGESLQDLGILAQRVASGPGGIDRGSMVSVVRALQQQVCSSTDDSSPGILIANPGQTYWWPEAGRAITVGASCATPLSSLVKTEKKYCPQINSVPGNENAEKHINYLLDHAPQYLLRAETKVDIIAVGNSCETLLKYFDDAGHWEVWKNRINAVVWLDSVYSAENMVNDDFRDFMAKRSCGYIVSDSPFNTPLATPAGNPDECIPELGYPVFSSGETRFTEMILIKTLPAVLSYLENLALDPDFENPVLVPAVREPQQADEEDAPCEELWPSVDKIDDRAMQEQVRDLKLWEHYSKFGEMPVPQSDEDD